MAIALSVNMLLSNAVVFAANEIETASELTTAESIKATKQELLKKRFNKPEIKIFKGSIEDLQKKQKHTLEQNNTIENSVNNISNLGIGSPAFGKSAAVSETTKAGVETHKPEYIAPKSLSASDYEAVIRPSYANGVYHPHLAGRSTSDYVSPFDGTLQLNFTDLSLPGKNGLDLNINRFYKSELSNVEASNPTGNIPTVNHSTYFTKRYALGLGWSFGFPSVELREQYDGTTQAFYHDGTGATYRSNYNDSLKNEEGEDYYNGHLIYCSNLDNYYTDNVRFKEKDRSYQRGNYRSQYSFKTADNTMQYFGKDGQLLSIKDRFNNEITFDYVNLPGENILPFDSYNKFSFGNKWSSSGSYFKFSTGSSSRYSTEATSYKVELNELYDEYYVSLLYDAIDNIYGTFNGSFQIYCDLYDGSTLLESVLLATESPSTFNEIQKVEAEFSINDLDLYETPTHARMRIKMVSSRYEIQFDDFRLSPKTPLLSRITDTIGRTVDFTYEGDIYTRYEDDPWLTIDILVKDPNGNEINDLTYYRGVYSYTTEEDGTVLCEDSFFLFWGCWNGDYSSWVDYDWKEGWASSHYANPNIYEAYEFYGRPIVKEVEHRNSTTYFTYEDVTKWIDNRPRGSSATATTTNTGFMETWRVAEKHDVNEAVGEVTNPNINSTTYNYSSGYFTSETGYNRKSKNGMEPGFLDPDLGNYKVIVTNPNGSMETYEYTTHIYDTGFRRKWEVELPLLDKKTAAEGSSATADTVVEEYEYTDNYALISPNKIKTTEKNSNVSRVYYTKTEYSEDSCLPTKQSLPLTETEAAQSAIPNHKAISTTYTTLTNRLFLPINTTYYQNSSGSALTESINRDSLGRVTSTINAKGDVTHFEYDQTYPWLPSRIYYTDPENIGDNERISETVYGYNGSYGLAPTLTKVKYADGSYSESTASYDPKYGNIVQSVDPKGNTTNYTYDYLGRIQYVKYPSYSAESGTKWLVDYYSYSNWGEFNNAYTFRITKTKRQTNSATATYGTTVSTEKIMYDDYGYMVYRQTDVGEEQFVYDNSMRVIAYKDPRDFGMTTNTVTYTYDGFNRVKSATDRMGNKQQVTYKSLSNEYSFVPNGTSAAENHYYEYYDLYGNLVQTKIFPNGINSTAITNNYSYDLVGNLLQHTDGNNKITTFTYDLLNNPIQVLKADGSVVKTDYTKWNTPLRTKQYDSSNEYSTENTYDDRGLVTSSAQKGLDIQTRPWYNEYGLNSELLKATDPNGTIKSFDYDAQGHLTTFVFGSKTDTMKYNHFGQLDKVVRTDNDTNAKILDYTYNNLGRLTSKQFENRTTTYSYNIIGSITGINSLNNLMRAYERDALERISKVSADGKDFVYEYYGDGMIKKLTYPSSNIMTTYTYDNANRLKTLETKRGTTTLKTYSYSYDNADNIISVSGSDNIAYTYDDLYRLKTYTQNGVTTTYNYDSRNNLISETKVNFSKQYEYSGDNRLKKVVENGVETEYSYDLNGNLINRGYDEFGYDANNRMIYSKIAGIETSYEVGLDEIRVSKTTGNVTTTYGTDENGKVITENSDEIINGHAPLAKKSGAAYYYYIYNGHGDVVMLLDENGNTKNTYEYDPWGSITTQTETIDNSIKYAGEYFDDETGLIYLRNRYYDPSVGRFISEDPIKDGMNWYAYCGGNPVNFIDSSGLEAVVVSGGNYGESTGYKYNFIEPAIKKVRELRGSMPDERIGWVIANAGWTSNDWSNFQAAVADIDNVHIIVMNSPSDLTNYINYRSTSGLANDGQGNYTNYRTGDEITKFAVFSHGNPGKLMLGFDYSSSNDLDYNTSHIAGIQASAFNNPNSWFYSCNTATGGDDSFLRAWHNKVGGFAGGYSGTTTYRYMTYSEAYFGYWNVDPRKWSEKSTVDGMRKKYGFSTTGSLRYPIASSGVSQVTYR